MVQDLRSNLAEGSAAGVPAGPDRRIDVLGLTAERFAQAVDLAVTRGAGKANELYRRLFLTGKFDLAAACLGPEAIAAYEAAFHVTPLRVVKVVEEVTDAGITAKAILATHDGYEIECVRIPMHADDQTLCLSSQVGCRMGCSFCETARLGLIRHLTAGEIVAQVFTARHVLGWQPRNLVFMGMGEALDNADNLIAALEVLTDKRAYHYSHERLTVCTAGHAAGLQRLTALGWKRLNLSVSLNSGDDATRSRLMPVNRMTPLAELQRILAAYPQRRNFTLGVNVCLMPGINDGPEDAQRIADFCRPLGRVLLNLIPYNPGNAPLTRAPSEDEVVVFVERLREQGLAVRRRITKGRSIMAACGQLGNADLRRRRRQDASSVSQPASVS
jgi:23S rRNA (adenine2503-C2)-methyltransferase